MGTLSVWPSMRISIFSGPMIFTVAAGAGMVCGPSWVEPLWKKPASRRLTTMPSLLDATEMMRLSICRASASSSFFCNSSILGRSTEPAAGPCTGLGSWPMFCMALDVFDDLHVGNRSGIGAGERYLGAGRIEDAHLLKGHLDGHGQLPGLAFFDLRGGIIDVHIHHVGHGVEREIPHVLANLRARHALAGIAHQILQQAEFLGCQLDRAARAF